MGLEAMLQVNGKIVIFALALIGLAACSAFTSQNEHFTQQERDRGQSSQKYSGAFIASTNIAWDIPWGCRDKLTSWKAIKATKSLEISDNLTKNGTWPASSDFCDKFCLQADPGEISGTIQRDKNFVALALSGGGMRAAVYSGAIMFELGRRQIMQDVDVISSVSGGSIAAAYYGLSCDGIHCLETVENQGRCRWRENDQLKGNNRAIDPCEDYFSEIDKDLELRWIANWFFPDNIVSYWFTNYDRSDTMAEVMADNLFDTSQLGGEGFSFHDFNPRRPHILINATDNTEVEGELFGNLKSGESIAGRFNFQFTHEDFAKVCSNLDRYPVANAVMASSAYPVLFSFVTLTNQCGQYSESGIKIDGLNPTYRHVFDGGNSDNLGLLGLHGTLRKLARKIDLKAAPKTPDKTSEPAKLDKPDDVIIFQANASLGVPGRSKELSDTRGIIGRFFDTNIIDTTDVLMGIGYDNTHKETDNLLEHAAKNSRPVQRIDFRLESLQTIAYCNVRRGEKNYSKRVPEMCKAWDFIQNIGTRFSTDSKQIRYLRYAACKITAHKLKKVCDAHPNAAGYIGKMCNPETTPETAAETSKRCTAYLTGG